MRTISLGIDTSCYTTSLVAIDENNQILYEGRNILTVKEGTVGLRQSDAFFQHVQNLPVLYDQCLNVIDVEDILCITVSDKPRNVHGSYMPVFLAGLQFAKVISKSLKVSLNQLSHQENHLFACMYNHPLPKEFIGAHISGGTTEILKVYNERGLKIEIISGSLDISIGQLIDRLGVYMGLSFPCGKQLDALSVKQKPYHLKLSIKDVGFNISGIENQLKKHFDLDGDVGKIAYTLFDYITRLLIKVLSSCQSDYKTPTIVLSGGVSANSIIREKLKVHFDENLILVDHIFATDHALGNAYYGNVVMTY